MFYQVGNLGLLFMLLFFIYAALGVELFGELGRSSKPPEGEAGHMSVCSPGERSRVRSQGDGTWATLSSGRGGAFFIVISRSSSVCWRLLLQAVTDLLSSDLLPSDLLTSDLLSSLSVQR